MSRTSWRRMAVELVLTLNLISAPGASAMKPHLGSLAVLPSFTHSKPWRLNTCRWRCGQPTRHV